MDRLALAVIVNGKNRDTRVNGLALGGIDIILDFGGGVTGGFGQTKTFRWGVSAITNLFTPLELDPFYILSSIQNLKLSLKRVERLFLPGELHKI